MTEKNYTPREVATLLGINNSTVRKYATLLENYNYYFERDFAKNRIYTNANIKIFQELIDLSPKLTLAKAAELLTTEYRQSDDEILQENISIELDKIKEQLHKQEAENRALTEKVQILEDHLVALLHLFQEKDNEKQFLNEFNQVLNKI